MVSQFKILMLYSDNVAESFVWCDQQLKVANF